VMFTVTEMSLPLAQKFMESYELTPAGDGATELLWRVYYEPAKMVRGLEPLLRPLFGADFRTATRRLKACLERRSPPVDRRELVPATTSFGQRWTAEDRAKRAPLPARARRGERGTMSPAMAVGSRLARLI